MTELSPGSLVGGYRIEGLAGDGGMGVVYRATQLALGRPVALKVIAPQLADDPQFRERFKRESQLAACLDHPNIIPVYEAGEADGCLFISMRYVVGTDLRTLIHRGGGVEPGRAAAIVAQVAAALDSAHERGLVHRDVKPANVLIATGHAEHAYLTDFGLVKRVSTSGALTASGHFVGTLDYIAPEQIKGKAAACSDVYSLGCVLFHCLAGRVPFEADSEVAKMYAHLNERPPCPSEIVPDLPPQLDAVVTKAMAKERQERYPSAGELGRAALAAAGELSSTRAEVPVFADRPPPSVAAPAAEAPPAKEGGTGPAFPSALRRRWTWVSLLAVAVVVAVLVAALSGGDPAPTAHTRAALPRDGALV